MTQCDCILEHLRTGATITPAQAYEIAWTLALHSRISELRARGHNIACELWRTPGGKHVGRYRLVEQQELFA